MKKIVCISLLFMWILFFITCPNDAASAGKDGIMLWFFQILPILLPYAILSNIIVKSNLIRAFSGRSAAAKRKLPLAECFVLFCGFLFGFPLGSKLCADFGKRGDLSPDNAQILCAATNNLSPGFVSVYVLTNALQQPEKIPVSFLILYGIPLTYAIVRLLVSRFFSAGQNSLLNEKKTESRFVINMEIIDSGITQSFETLIRLCGYIVIFSLTACMVHKTFFLPETFRNCAVGFLEVTNGIAVLSNLACSGEIKYLLAMTMLSFGGLSGLAQTASVIRDSGLSICSYLCTRLVITFAVFAAAFFYCF